MGVRRRAGGGGRSRLTITTFHLGAVGSRAEPSIRSTVVEESVSDSLVERFLQCPAARGGPERRLDTVTLLKKDGSLGVMIAEGVDHGLYIQAVSPGGPAALQGNLKPGDRIVGINGRSVETLPYAAAVDLLRQISDSVTLLVSQPVVASSSSSSSAPARASSTHTTQAHTTPIVSPDARASAGPGGEGEARERKEARVQLLGGARSFITEVRSGPVTVITLNATPPPASSPAPPDPAPAVSTFEISVGPRVPAEGVKGGEAGGGPAQAVSSKQTAQIRKSRPVPTPRRSLTSSGSSTGPGPDSSSDPESSALPQSWSSLPDLKGAERGTPHTSCRGRVPRPRARRCSDSSRPDRRDGSFSHQARTVARDWPPPVRVTPSAVRRRPSLYRAELVQNDDQDRFSTCSSAESLAATPTRPRLRPATRESCFSTYDLCTTDNSRFFTVGNDDNDNKQYRTFHREFGMDLEGEAARGLDSRGRTVGGHEAWREPGAWEASVHETREGKSKSLVTESESGATKQYIKGACGPVDKQPSILSGQSGDGVSKRTSNIHNILGASSNKKSDCVSGATNKHSVHRLTNQIYSGTTNKPSDLLYSPRNKESDVACVVHKDDFKQELSDKLSSVNRNICESTYEFGRLGDDLASKGSLEQDSVSSGPLSLVPWQGSSECLLDDPCTGMEKRRKEEGGGGGVGEGKGGGEVSASLSLPDLPKDTMLDRVLRCFDALHIAHSQIALRHENQDGGKGVVLNKDNLESMDTELWKHRFGIEDSRHNLFFRDFSLEEREFPESSAGSVSSAADQERIHVDQLINCSLEVQESSLCRSSEAFNRTSHTEASSTSSSPTPVTEVIITPPEGFRCDPDPSLSDEESSDSQGKPLADEGENSPVSQTEIAGNPEHIGTAVPHTQNNVDDTLHSQINERENRKGNEPPTQTQAQEIVIEAAGTSEDKVPFRLITEREYQYHLKIKRKESASEASESEECKEPPSENKQKQECGKTQTLLEGEIGSPKRLSNTVRPSRVAYLKGLLFGGAENQPDTSASATKSKDKGSDTNRTSQPKLSCVDAHDVYSTKDNGSNVSKDAPSVFEESYSIHDQLIRSKICEKIRTSSNSEGNERKSSVSTQASTGTHVESDYSSSSTGTPPPVNFTTHPLSSTSSKENLLDEGNSDSKEVPVTINEDVVGDSTVCISPPETKKNRFLSAQNESRFPLHKMYPDSDSESDEEEEAADIKTKANVELSALSLESEKSEELELFINNPESMIVGKVCISEEDTAFEVEEDANPEATEGGEGDEASELIVFRLHVPEPSARTPSPSPPLRDGWGVDSGPTVSEELLSLEGEQFVELLPTLVKDELPTVSAQATGDPADDATPMVKVPYVLISEDVRQSYETTVTRADLDSCDRWVVESRSEAPVSRMYAGATDSSPSSLSADGADSDEELEIFHTTESTPSDSHFAGPDVSDRDSATRSWSHEDHCSISEGTPLVASTKTGNDNSLIREKQKTELTVILGNTKINSRELDGYSLKNETPYFVSIRNLDIQNESAEKVKNGSEYNKSENMKDPASKYQLSDVEEEYDPAILESTESAKSRSLVGTFNFLGSEKSSSLANTPSEGPESLDDSYASLQDGVTVLGTYNFVGAGVPADAGVLRCGERPEESPELPSLTDSIISLEDGKHLLGVFDFTKPKHDLRTKARASSSEGRSSSVQCEYKDAASEEKTPDPVVQDTGLEEEVGCVQDPEGKGKSNTTEDSVSMQNRGLSPTTAEDARPSQAPPGPNSAVSQEESPQKFPSVEAVCQSPAQREEAEDGDLTQEDAEAAGEAKDVCVEAAAADDDSQAGERVVEVYGGVTNHAHAPPTTVSGRSGHVDPAHPQLVDPALLTSLDLESDHAAPAHEMLVTDAPHSTRPHDLNHNNHAFGHKSSEDHVSGRAAKYMVAESGDLAGHDNYAFDHDILSGQDNYGYDPGYSSERSPEDEEGPPLYCSSSSPASSSAAAVAQRERSPREPRDRNSLKVAPGEIINTLEVMRLVPFITESTTFQVTVIKNLRGLGLAVTGGIECDLPYAGLIRIKKLYPQTPAWLCGQLEVGDILLQANDNPLTGLTSHEALEMLRTVGQEVTLEICRPPPGTMGDGEDLPDGGNTLGVVSTSLTTPNTSHNYLSPSPSFSSCGEFEVQLTKVAGSLGFTLRKQDNSILGHTIRSLVKEPAISDGRLRPGDKIISVNNTDMCSLSHEEAIGFLRTCPETVTLRLYRDAMQTPVSPVSPTEPDILAKPKPLRKEARDMLSDLAFRKQSPSNSPSLAGASGSPGTPRRRRLQKTPSPDIKSVVIDRWDSLVRKTEESLPGTPTLEKKTSLNSIRETDHEVSPFGDSQTDDSLSTTIRSRNSSASSSSLTASNSESRPKRPSFLDLSNGRGCPRKTQFTPPHEVDRSFPSPLGGNYPSADSLDSAPQLTSAHSDTPAFSHLQQGYQSVNLGALHPHEDSRLTNTTSDHNISSHDTDGPQQSGLLKWKGIVFTPEEEDTQSLEESLQQEGDREGSPQSHKPKMVTIELNRGWNSRLGFSLQPKGENTVIKAIYADSVAAKDGRLKMGDIVVKVNGIDVVGWETESVIDLLRKTRGKISVTVLQPLS